MTDDRLRGEWFRPGAELAVRQFEHEAMACTFGLTLVEPDGAYAACAARAAWNEVDRLELELSRFAVHSDIARVPSLRAGEELPLGAEVYECLELAAVVCQQTGGAFDVTARTGGDGQPGAVRGAGPLLELDPARHVIVARAANVQLDLGGIGKGYALDRLAELLCEWRIEAGLIHAGQSTVVAWGEGRGGAGWQVEVRDPAGIREAWGTVHLRGRALSGSGQLLHGNHIVDPRTGIPACGTSAAWALAPTGARADALSTAFMVMAPKDVESYCARHDEVSAIVMLPGAQEPEVVCFGAGFDGVRADKAGENMHIRDEGLE